MGGSTADVAIVVAGPFIGNLLSPVFAYLLAHVPIVRVVAGAASLSRFVFMVSVLLAATPFMLALTSVTFWIITVSNIAAYTALMQGIYPDRERAFAMGNVRVGASIAGIAAAALAGTFIDVVPVQWVFGAAALVGLPGALAFFWIRYEGPAAPPARRPALAIARDVWADLRYRKLLLAFTLFGTGNLMNFAVFPILLVDHFDASNGFVGTLAIVQSATQIVAYPVIGRIIDRGSTLRQTLIATLLTLLVPIGYLVAPSTWALLPVAVIIGVAVSSGELTAFTNIVHMAPRARIAEYAAANAFLLGVRGTAAPFIAAALLGMVPPQVVLVLGTLLMTTGALVLAQLVRAPALSRVEVAPAEA
jgi:MFS family permease